MWLGLPIPLYVQGVSKAGPGHSMPGCNDAGPCCCMQMWFVGIGSRAAGLAKWLFDAKSRRANLLCEGVRRHLLVNMIFSCLMHLVAAVGIHATTVDFVPDAWRFFAVCFELLSRSLQVGMPRLADDLLLFRVGALCAPGGIIGTREV